MQGFGPNQEVRSIRISSQLEAGILTYEQDAKLLLEDNSISPYTELVKVSLANFYLRQGEVDQAATVYAQVNELAVAPWKYVEVEYGLAVCQFEAGNFEGALPAFKALLGHDRLGVGIPFYLGFIYYKRGNFSEALRYLKQSSDPRAEVMIAGSYAQLGQKENLRNFASEALASDETAGAELHRLLADSYFEEADYEKASQHYNETLKTSLVDASVHYRLAYIYETQGDVDLAIDHYKIAALEKSKIGQSSAYRLGFLYLGKGNFEFASASFQKAAEQDYSSEIKISAHFLSGKLKMQMERYDQGIQILEDFIEQFPTHENVDEASSLLSEAWLRTPNYDRVIAFVETRSSKTDVMKYAYQQAAYLKGLNLYTDGAYNAAIRYLNKSLRFVPDEKIHAASLYWKAESFLALDDHSNAKEALLSGVRLPQRDIARVHYLLGFLELRENQAESAINHFRTSIRHAENDSIWRFEASIGLADSYFFLEQYQRSEEVYRQQLSSGRESNYINFQLARIAQVRGVSAEAIVLYRQVSEVQGELADQALFQIGNILFEESRFDEASAEYAALIDRFPGSSLVSGAQLRQGLALVNSNQLEAAKQLFKFVLRTYTRDQEARDALLALQDLEKKGESIPEMPELISIFKEANPESSSLEVIDFEQIKTVYFNGEYDRMGRYARSFYKEYPNSNFTVDVQYYVADGYYQKASYDEAIDAFGPLLQHQDFDYFNRILDKRGRSMLLLNRGLEAVDNYQLLLKKAASGKDQYLALEGLMKAHFQLESDSVLFLADAILQASWLPLNGERQAQLFKIRVHGRNGQWDQVKELSLGLTPRQDRFSAESTYWHAVAIAADARFQESNELVFDIIKNYGQYPDWVGRGYLLLVDNYLAMGEVLQAEATNNSILENAEDDRLVTEARQKLSRIEEAKSKLLVLPSDSTASDTLNVGLIEKDSLR